MQQGTRLVSWEIIYTKQAQKDAKKLAAVGLKDKALQLLEILKNDPFQNPPPYEKLVGDVTIPRQSRELSNRELLKAANWSR